MLCKGCKWLYVGAESDGESVVLTRQDLILIRVDVRAIFGMNSNCFRCSGTGFVEAAKSKGRMFDS